MNRKQIAGVMWWGCWICLLPASYGLFFVIPSLVIPGMNQLIARAILLLFGFGLMLMRGYWRLWRGRPSWPSEGWIWGWTALANAAPIVFVFPEFLTMQMKGIESISNQSSNPGEWLLALFLMFILLWWPLAAGLGGWAWGQWLRNKSRESVDDRGLSRPGSF